MRRWIRPGILVLFLSGFVWGCAAPQPETFRVDDARAELKALQASEEAESVATELQDVASLVETAKLALEQGKPEEAQQIAELALLRIEYARTLARTKQYEATAKQLEERLEALAQEIDGYSKQLGEAKAELDSLNATTPTEGVPAK